MDLQKYAQSYINFVQFQKRLDCKTIKAYRIDLSQFVSFLSGKPLSKESVYEYISYLNGKYSPRSTKRKLVVAKSFCLFLVDEGFQEGSPFEKIKIAIKEPKRLPRTVPLETIKKILISAYGRANSPNLSANLKKAAARDAAIIELLIATGIRISELCHLKIQDVDLKRGRLRIIGKGDKERRLQIGSQDTLAALKIYFNLFKKEILKSKCFFVNKFGRRLSEESVREMLNNYCRRLHIQMHITPHMFRHTFATTLLESNVSIRYIQQFLGHSSIVTTQIYTSISDKQQRIILTTKNPRRKISFFNGTTPG